MEDVVERGTAKLAQIPGYTIAGKTGTASKLIDGRYSANENNVSFVGFVPSREPAVAIIVVIDSPHANGNSGGTVAAPIFKRIAEASLDYLGVGPTINPGSAGHRRPPNRRAGGGDRHFRCRRQHEAPQSGAEGRRA